MRTTDECGSFGNSSVKQITRNAMPPALSQCSESLAVSVIVPAYNTAEFISEALDSIFHQTFRNFEVIVVNDGSPDTETLERVLEPYRARVIYVKQENRGLAGARNTAIRRARGKYLAFLDSDDSWLPEYLETQIELLERAPKLDALYCDSRCFGDLRFTGQTFMQLCPSMGAVTLEALLTNRCQVCISCTVVRSRVVIDAGLFDEQLRAVEDWDLWLRILHRGGAMAYHRAVLGRRRIRAGAISTAPALMMSSGVRTLRKLNDTLELSPAMRSLLSKRLRLTEALFELEQAKIFLASNRDQLAAESLQKANDFLHSTKLNLVLFGIRTVPNLTRLGSRAWSFALTGVTICRSASCFAKRAVLGMRHGDSTPTHHS